MPEEIEGRSIIELLRRVERLEAVVTEAPALAPQPPEAGVLAWPPDIADGQQIMAAHINAIKNSVGTWVADVDGQNFNLVHVKYFEQTPAALGDTAGSLQVATIITGFSGNADYLRVWMQRKVTGSGYGNAAWILERLIDGSYSSSSLQFVAGGLDIWGAQQLLAQILDTGVFLKNITTTPGAAGSGKVYKDAGGFLKIS
jgi:hypothetical protein